MKGDNVCIISTGYMTHKALQVAKEFEADNRNIGVVDMFMLKPACEDSLFELIKKYKTIITIEEGFVNKGGLDSLISNLLRDKDSDIKLKSFGFSDDYIFKCGDRELLYEAGGFCQKDLVDIIKKSNA